MHVFGVIKDFSVASARIAAMEWKPRTVVASLLALGLALAATGVQADVYKYRDAYGRTLLTDRPMKGGGVVLVKVFRFATHKPKSSAADVAAQRRRSYTPLINHIAREQRLQPALLHAVVRAESAYDPQAVSSKGAVGLMQLMPDTAARYGVRDRHDPRQNLRGGARYLRDLLVQFGNDLKLALAAYNAGENAVLRYGRQVPPFPETQAYVRKVTGFYREQQSASMALR
jgi:hypothetical protein